jgi:RND family efflux transporter MFP subunit
VAAVLVGLPIAAPAQAPVALVEVDAVRVEEIVQTFPVLGRFVAAREGDVASRVSGAVEEVLVEVGDRVVAGQTIASIDGDRLRFTRDLAEAALNAARAELATAQARLAVIAQQRDRLERLQGSAAFSRAGLEDKLSEMAVARSELEAARAGIARAEVTLREAAAELAHAQIRAPYPAVVVRRFVSPGAWLSAGEPVVALVDDLGLEIEADVPGERAALLTQGREVTIEVERTTQTVSVRAVVPVENPMTRTRAVRFTLGPRSRLGGYAAGQSVLLHLPDGAAQQALTVHKDAVTLARGRPLVFVADTEKAEEREIVIGAAFGGRFEVLDGLEAGELVVTRGNERLRPGQSIAFDQPAGPGTAARPEIPPS